MTDPATRASHWKLSLLDLTASNRLLDVTSSRMTVPLPAVDPPAIAAALAEGAGLALAAGPARPGAPAVLSSSLAEPELARRLVALRRAGRAQLADGGVHTLWLGLGILVWCDVTSEGETVARRAPLALWPVELVREPGGGFRLALAAGLEPRGNQTLREKLRREIGAVLPAAEDGDELDLEALFAAAEAIAAERPGWRVEHAAELGIFGFAKFVMWNDLDARAGELLASPVVAHLAAGDGTAFVQPSPEAEHAVTAAGAGRPVAGELIAPLDADASQLAAIAAAGAGASFVLQGPPGTGKSQTIANLIVHAVAHGKTVLFVTEKAAALEVVHQRLTAIGLGEVCLALHSHKAVRAQVVGQLGRVLERAFRPVAGPASSDARLAELRAALDDHARAMHRVGPFGRSLHQVLGRLVELRSAPRAALAERDAVGLDGATFERRRLAVAALGEAAGAAWPVAAHPWRAARLARWALDGRDRALAALDEAAAAAGELGAALRELALRVPGVLGQTREQLRALGELARLAAASPRPGAELLTQLRLGEGEDVAERIALVRARGGGAIDPPRDPGAFLLLASRHRLLATEVEDRFTDAVAGLDAPALWQQLRRWARRLAPLRYLALRRARAEIRAAAMPGMVDTDGAMITALEAVIAERAARDALIAAAEPARRWFGELGGDPLALDLARIDAAVGWAAELRRAFDAVAVAHGPAGRAAAWRALVAQVAASPGDDAAAAGERAAFARLAGAVQRWQPALAALAEATGIAEAELGAGDDHLPALLAQLAALRPAVDALRDWVAFHAARTAAHAAGVGPAIAAVERGELGAAELADAWERATLLAWADAELAATPALARFHGPAHHASAVAFADLDRATLALIRTRALIRIAERVPRVTADPGGELGVLLHETRKQRGHRPLRRLFAEIPTLLPRLAPCLLMSPLSVAQYLDPALPRFDLVVFDEASQLPTADAIGALARGNAAVVVGDARQLPPTRFFAAGAGELESSDEDDAAALVGGIDNALDDCIAARLPELRLAWHYRSRHEDLIAFSNRRYYGDRLQVFPAAHRSPDLGIAWRRVAGVYDRGGTRQNRIEAEAVVAEVLARLRDPAQRARSIGVVTFSRAQQELVEDLLDQQLDAARADSPEIEAWLDGGRDAGAGEPVLVKNLETIQGDERDVVLLSVGYGPDAAGDMTRNLGPLSQHGGERRLNVAITRAREQLIVFSSFGPADLDDAAGQGVQDLAALLAFAEAGGGAARPASDAPAASPITGAIARALAERGWTVHHQVGCGAYKLDLAIVDPGDPERYVLAIEHDGAAYASAPAARDRDRLRAQVLGQLGWRLHRIWSLDWWADPEREAQRAHGAIVAAVAASRRRSPSATGPRAMSARSEQSGPHARAALTGRPAAPAPRAVGSGPVGDAVPRSPGDAAAGSRRAGGPAQRARSDAPDRAPADPAAAVAALLGDTAALATGSVPIPLARNAIPIGPYRAAAIPAGRRTPDDLFAPRHLAELGKIVEQVLAAEAPVHLDVLARRVAGYFGIGRLTPRVTDQVRVALAGRGRWGDEGDVVWRLDQDPAAVPAVRVASEGASARRAIHEVPLAEVAAAARIVVERAVGIAAADLVRDAARLLGFARITDRVIERVAAGVRLAAQRNLIVVAAGRATLPGDR